MAKTAKKPAARPKRPAAKKKATRRKPLEKAVDPNRLKKEAGWEAARRDRVEALRGDAAGALEQAAQCSEMLAKEPSLRALKAEHETRIAESSERIDGLRPEVRVGQLQREYGAAEAEKATSQREANLANDAYRRLVEGASACGECGTPIHESALDQHLIAAEQRVADANNQVSTFTERLRNLGPRIHDLITGDGDAVAQSLKTAIEESTAVIAKCDQALEAIVAIRENQRGYEARATELEQSALVAEGAANPFSEASA